jgi:DNA-binding transcriptional LysR family regulator
MEEPMISEFDYYKTFYMVAKTQNITQAAELLCVSQPSVTKSIHNLEKLLDRKLFTRSTKGVQLTPAGKLLFKRVQPAYLMLTAAEQELKNTDPQSSATIRIGTGSQLYNYFLLPYITEFCEAYPNCRIEFVNHEDYDLSSVKYANADFSLDTPWPIQDTSNLNIERIAKSKELLVGGNKYGFLKNHALSVAELAEYPLIMVSRNIPVRNYYEELFASYGVTLTPRIEVESANFLTSLAANNLGLCFVRQHFAESLLSTGSLIELSTDFPLMDGGEVVLITHKDRMLSPEAQAFINLLKQ